MDKNQIIAATIIMMMAICNSAQMTGSSFDKTDLEYKSNTPVQVIDAESRLSQTERDKLLTTFSKENVFIRLLTPASQNCYPICVSEYIYTNPDSVRRILRVDTEIYDLKGDRSDDYISDIKMEVAPMIEYCGLYNGGECTHMVQSPGEYEEVRDTIQIDPKQEKVIRITGTKKQDVDLDWKPTIYLTKEDNPSFSTDAIVTRETTWALWLKGAAAHTGSSLRLWWKMDEASGTNAQDASGNLYNGTIASGVVVNKAGVIGKSYYFNNSGQVTLASQPTLNSNKMSICFWAYANESAESGWIANRGDEVSGGWEINTNGNYFILSPRNASNIYTSVAARTYSPYVWTHTCFSLNTTHQFSYTNGTYYTNTALATNAPYETAKVLHVGSFDGAAGANSFKGFIDEFQIYNRTLTANEVRDLYEAGITQSNITYPTNDTTTYVGGSYRVNVTAVIGFADQTLASNITYINGTGGVHALRTNAGVETNTSTIFLTRANSTHYTILDSTTYAWGVRNISITSCGGNGLITCDTQTRSFIIASNPPSVGYSMPYMTTGTYDREYINTNILCSSGMTVDTNWVSLIMPGFPGDFIWNTQYSTSTPFAVNWTGLMIPSTWYVKGYCNDSVGQLSETSQLTITLQETVTTTTLPCHNCLDNITTLTGTYDSGNLASTYYYGDNVTYKTSETATVPGSNIFMEWTGINNPGELNISYYIKEYGNPTHQVWIQFYNNSGGDWIDTQQLTVDQEFNWYNISISNGASYENGTGSIKSRLYHKSSGGVSDYAEIEFVDMEYVIITTTTTTTLPVSSNNTGKTTPFEAMSRVDLKEALKTLYMGNDGATGRRTDGTATMGYWFLVILFLGLDFIIYLKYKSTAVAGAVVVILMSVFGSLFPPQAALVWWLIVVAGVATTLYGLFGED